MKPPRSPGRHLLAWFRTERALESLAYLACLLAPLLFFGRPLLLGRTLLSSDLVDQYWPYRALWADLVRDGVVPLWNPYMFSGMPLLGDPQFAALYPLNALFLLLPSLTAIQVYILLGYALLAAFTYYYARTLACSRLSAFIAALSLSFGLYTVIHLPHLTIVHCILWLPLQLGLVERLAHTRRARYALLLSVALALQILSGYPQFLFYSLLLLGGYLAFHIVFTRQSRGKLLVHFGLALLVGASLGAIQLLPAMELAILSSRQHMTYDQFSAYSVPLVMLVQFVAPFLFGAPSSFLHTVSPFIVEWDWELLFYPGALAALCLASVISIRRRGGWREIFWWLVLGWGVVFSLGDNTPIYSLVYSLPVYNWFRVAGRHLFLVSLAAAIIAGLRLESLLHAGRRAIAGTFGLLTLVGTALIVLAVVQKGEALRAHYGSTLWHSELLLPLLSFSLLFLALWPFGDGSHRQRPSWRLLLVGLVLADLFLTTATTVPSTPRTVAMDHQTEFRELAEVLPGDGGRFWYLSSQHAGNNYLFAPLPFATSYNPLIVQDYAQLTHMSGSVITSFTLDTSAAGRDTLWNLLDVEYILLPRAAAERPLMDRSCQKRIEGYCFAHDDTRLQLFPEARLEFALPPGQALTGLGLISALTNAPHLPDQTPVAELRFLNDENELVAAVPLLAGSHTAEWAADCLPPETALAHPLPPVASSWETLRGNGGTCQGHTYFASIELDPGLEPSRLIIENTGAAGEIWLDGISLRQESGLTTGYVLESGRYSAIVPVEHPDVTMDRFLVYRRQPAWGHAWPVGSVQAMASSAFLQDLYGSEHQLDLANVAYIDEAALADCVQTWPGLSSTEFDANASVHLAERTPNALTLEVSSTGPAFIVLSEVYYPGWMAQAGGRTIELCQVDHALRGLVLPAGTHRIDLAYKPRSFSAGMALGMIGVGLAIVYAWLSFRSGRNRSPSPPDQEDDRSTGQVLQEGAERRGSGAASTHTEASSGSPSGSRSE